MINKITISLILLLLFGCSSKVAFPVILEQSGDAAYGYTKENPIRMGFSDDLVENVDLCRYFISRLRTKDMIGFYIDSRYSLADPKYKNTLLDAYTIISDNKTDT